MTATLAQSLSSQYDSSMNPEQTFEIRAGADAFGDGAHPTTAMMLAALEAIDPAFAPRIACDMGAGSGILAMAITARFACPVIAAELERQAIEILQENALHNGLEGRISAIHSDGFRHPAIRTAAPFDLIVMNILAEALLALATDAVSHLASEGVLLLSGILIWQETAIREAYAALGLELTTRLSLGDWVALGWQKP